MFPRSPIAALCCGLVVAWCGVCTAGERLRLARVDASVSPTVTLYADDLDSDGNPIANRPDDAFKLLLDGTQLIPASRIRTARAIALPVDVVVVAELSSAMVDALPELGRGIRLLGEGLPPGSRMALIGYAGDRKQLTESLGAPADAISAANTMTIDADSLELRFLDALRAAITLVGTAPAAPASRETERRKLIVAFSDGIDADREASTFANLGDRALDARVVIDTIGYAPFEERTLKELGMLSRRARGTERTCKTPRQIVSRFQSVLDELDDQYVVTFQAPRSDANGRQHSFQLIVGSDRRVYSNEVVTKLPRPVTPGPNVTAHSWWAIGVVALLLLASGIVAGVLSLRASRPAYEPPVEPTLEASAPPVESSPPVQPPTAARRKTIALGAGGIAPMEPFPIGWLVGLNGCRIDQTIPLARPRAIIGSATECDVQVDDESISWRHCEIRLDGTAFRLVDIGATNGVLVNGKRVREHELIDNDVVALGRCQFKFKCVG